MLTTGMSCCEARSTIVCESFVTCVNCGAVGRRELDARETCWEHRPTIGHRSVYTRKARFQKILAALLLRTEHRCDESLLLYLKSEKRQGRVTKPEDIIKCISKYKTSIRKPYMFARYYWREMVGSPTVIPSRDEIEFIVKTFNEIFYAWTRLSLKNPRFPMATAIRLIVHHFDLSNEAKFMCRFARVLRCQTRAKRYEKNFKLCIAYIKQHAERTGWQELPR